MYSENRIELLKNRIDSILFKNNLGQRFEPDDFPENILFKLFQRIGSNFSNNYNYLFGFSNDKGTQAVIFHKEKLIVMSFGMFDTICKIAETITISGVFINCKIEHRYFNIPYPENPFIYKNSNSFYTEEPEELLFLFHVIHEIIFIRTVQ